MKLFKYWYPNTEGGRMNRSLQRQSIPHLWPGTLLFPDQTALLRYPSGGHLPLACRSLVLSTCRVTLAVSSNTQTDREIPRADGQSRLLPTSPDRLQGQPDHGPWTWTWTPVQHSGPLPQVNGFLSFRLSWLGLSVTAAWDSLTSLPESSRCRSWRSLYGMPRQTSQPDGPLAGKRSAEK